MQRMVRVQGFGRQHGEQLHHHAPARVVFHQVVQVCGEIWRGWVAARHARREEVLRRAGLPVVFVIYQRQHFVFVVDVSQHALFGDADPVGHVLDGNAIESTLTDQLNSRIQHFRSTLLR